MITRIEIDGFKSFLDFGLDVPPFLAVIGRNASGKSNLLDALTFVSAVARGDRLVDAVASIRGDAGSIFHRRTDGTVVDRMRFALEFSLARADLDARSPEEDAGRFPTAWRYETELRLVPQANRQVLRVVSETFFPIGSTRPWNGRGFPPPAMRVARGVQDVLRIPDRDAKAGWRKQDFLDWVPGSVCADELESLMVLRLEPTELARPSPLGHDVSLSPVGAGLAGYLQGIFEATVSEEHPQGVLPLIKARLTRMVKEITDFDLVTDSLRGDVRLRFTSRHHTGFEAEQASDGTLRILAVLAALYDPRRRGLLAIEEPENGVYPERLRDLIEIVRHEVSDRDWLGAWREWGDEAGAQVLVTSHSPVILDVAPRDEIVFLENATRVGGGVAASAVTRPRRLTAEGEAPQRDVSAVPAVSETVRETEAWALADFDALNRVLALPQRLMAEISADTRGAVEQLPDPKDHLARLIGAALGTRRPNQHTEFHQDFLDRLAEQIEIARLRKVPAFQQWWDDMIEALEGLGYQHG